MPTGIWTRRQIDLIVAEDIDRLFAGPDGRRDPKIERADHTLAELCHDASFQGHANLSAIRGHVDGPDLDVVG